MSDTAPEAVKLQTVLIVTISQFHPLIVKLQTFQLYLVAYLHEKAMELFPLTAEANEVILYLSTAIDSYR